MRCWAIFVAFLMPASASANQVLSILTQTQRLDSALVQEFETTRKVAVRVEFVSSSVEYEPKIRSLPHNWDLVLTEEQRLVSLSLAKVIKALPESIAVPEAESGLERRARANPDGRSYLNLMADPLGLMYLKNTLTSAGPVRWDWIIQPAANPLWRSRLALFEDQRMNLLTAAAATGLKFPLDDVQEAQKVQDWLSRAQLQGRARSLPSVISSFLAEKFVVGLAWQSDYVHAQRYLKNLAFTVPAGGTYVERVGVGLVSDCRNEALALDFIRFLYEKREQLAQRRGLLSLNSQEFPASQLSSWRIFADDVPHLKELTTALSRLKKDKNSKKAGARK